MGRERRGKNGNDYDGINCGLGEEMSWKIFIKYYKVIDNQICNYLLTEC